MATLSSIPESNPGASQPGRQSTRARRITSFERVRPRSRVIVLSRRPTRVKHRPREQGQEGNDGDERRRQLATNMAQRWTKARDARKTKLPPDGAISELDMPRNGRLVPSLDTGGVADPRQSKATPLHSPLKASGFTTPLDGVDGQDGHWSPTLPKESSRCHPHEHANCEPRREDTSPDVPEINQDFVDAVARNVVQQLQLMSLNDQLISKQYTSPKSPSEHPENQSRTSSQRLALNRFTNELQRYAEHTNAKGKHPVFTPTPARSGATLHTVAELVPFRPEFKAAGLAVTSKDQAKRPSYPTRANVSRAVRKQTFKPKRRRNNLSQMDGPEESGGTTTEISFISPRDPSDWRYALIGEVSPQNKRNTATKTSSKSRCFPCFPNGDDQTTEGEVPPSAQHAHSRAAAKASPTKAGRLTKNPRTPRKLPRAASAALPSSQNRPDWPSVRDVSSNIGPSMRVWHNADLRPRASGGMPRSQTTPSLASRNHTKPTGRRRPSMTLPWQDVLAQHQREMHRSQPPKPEWSFPPPNENETQNVHQAHGSRREFALHHPKPQHQSMPPQQIVGDLPKAPEAAGSMRNFHSAFAEATLGIPVGEEREMAFLKRDMASPIREAPKTMQGNCNSGPGSPTRRFPVTLCSRTLSSRPRTRPNIPKRTSSIRGSLRSVALGFPSREVVDRDVLRGLHIAAYAACDEEVDAFICNQTGLQIRQFLAGLIPFETLGDEQPRETREERVSRRRSEMRKLKQSVRRSREIRKVSVMTT